MAQNLNHDLDSFIDPLDILLALAYAYHMRKEPVVEDITYDKYKVAILRSDRADTLRRRIRWIEKKGYAPIHIRDLAFYLIHYRYKKEAV